MEGWALWCETTVDHVVTTLHLVLPRLGYRAAQAKGADHIAQLHAHDGGTLVMCPGELPNRGLATAIHEVVGGTGRYLELRLEDVSASATLVELPGGAEEDLDELALEILHDWNEGKTQKFRSESWEPLVEALLDLDYSKRPTKIVHYASDASPRVAALLRAIKSGATWERTTLGDRPAIRVKGATGAQVSVLSESEEAEFQRAMRRR